MTNIEKYNDAFVEVFGVDSAVLNDSFSKDSVESWDSVHQLNIIALLEESFDVMFDPGKNTKLNFKGQDNGKMGN